MREQNIINELEFATVLQEQNFREMPEFAKRCIEEFNVDRVRIRPIVPGGRLNRYEQWFMNVRNPEHPYHDEYLKVLSNQIFNHPKVSLWQGNLDSERISLSDMVENDVHRLSDSLSVERRVSNILSSMIMLEAFSEKFSDYMERKSFSRGAVWGMGKLGKAFLNMVDLKTAHIERLFDKELSGKSFKGIVIQEINLQKIKELDVIIITPVKCQNAMKSMLTEYTGEIVMLEDVIEEIKIFTEASQINER